MRSSLEALDGALTSRGTTCSSSSLKLRMCVRKYKLGINGCPNQNSTNLGSKTEMPPLPFIALTYAFWADTKRSSFLTEGAACVDLRENANGRGELLLLAATTISAARMTEEASSMLRVLVRWAGELPSNGVISLWGTRSEWDERGARGGISGTCSDEMLADNLTLAPLQLSFECRLQPPLPPPIPPTLQLR